MGRKHHSKKHHSTKHHSRKHKEEENNQLLNSNNLKDIFSEIIESNQIDVDDHKDSNKLLKKKKHHKKHKKHKKEKSTEYHTSVKEDNSSEDHYSKCVEDDSSEDHYSKCVEDDSPEDHYSKCVEDDSPEDHYSKCVEDDSSEDHYSKCVEDDSPEDHYSKCVEDDSSEDHYSKCIEDDSSEDHYNKCVGHDCSEDTCIEIYKDKFNKHHKSRKHYKIYKCKNIHYISKEAVVKCCEVSVKSQTLPLCPNTPQTPSTISRPVVIKVPVVLAEPKVTISIISSIELEDPALEIKRIRKNVYLTQCKLIPNSGDGDPDVGIIFISGFIRKNIEYATKNCSSKNVLCGNIKHTTVKVPFDCTTRITFLTRPIFIDDASQKEVEISENFIRTCNPCEESILGRSICEENLKFTEIFNEEVFCELVNVEIVECDILENPIKMECQTSIDHIFRDITEKVVMDLTIKILQNQQIRIP